MLELWLAFSAGLAGSGHCLGMCGGIVTALAISNSEAGAARRFLYNLFYHIGRVTTYATLGLLVGLASQAGLVTSLKPYLRWLFLAANLFVVAIGLCTAFGLRSLGISALDGSGWGFIQRLLARVSGSGSVLAALPAGLLMGLIPCGLVYGVLISAATSGSFLKGGGMMLAFGLGTFPALLLYGQVASAMTAAGGAIFQRFMGAVVALLGIAGVWKVLSAMGHMQAHH
ncbi:MAG: sulfite exporter TauE/SafE family protein [Deltaproteobacteria bacterium]|nr:sulfite exporter TauE/SafE family protein [Deltaproteobacteria bacterium]